MDYEFKHSFWLTRIIILRYLGFIYSVGFLVSLLQNIQLIGYNGLTPADIYMKEYQKRIGTNNKFELFLSSPTIFWFLPLEGREIDIYINILSWFGLWLSGFVLIFGKANKLILFSLWLSYMSIVNVGQNWYSFGWESQLLETGFLAIFMCNTFSMNMFSFNNKPSIIPMLLLRWLIFRIMIGAGMIKIRGDKCWKDLTCMNYHYETQPVPNPISYYMHNEPKIFHNFETLMNHFVELLAPFLLLLPQPLTKIGGLIQILFQIVLIISGNLSFLNWLTILPSLACFEDGDFKFLFNSKKLELIKHKLLSKSNGNSNSNNNNNLGIIEQLRKYFNANVAILLLVGYKSIPVIANVLSPGQIMNTSFDSFRLVNTYGAFGSITKYRTEIIIEGTHFENPLSKNAIWKEYEFKCKPGNILRRPCLISPYHYRLDWLMWFAAFQDPNRNVWFHHLLYKFLKNDGSIDTLIERNPFKNAAPPKWIRSLHYHYKFAPWRSNSSKWWTRTLLKKFTDPVNFKMFESVSKGFGWNRSLK